MFVYVTRKLNTKSKAKTEELWILDTKEMENLTCPKILYRKQTWKNLDTKRYYFRDSLRTQGKIYILQASLYCGPDQPKTQT